MWSMAFWRACVERAIKTGVQSVLLAFFAGDLIFDVFAADWQNLLGAFLGGALLSVLTSIASDAATGGTGPSLTNAEVTVPAGRHAAPPDE